MHIIHSHGLHLTAVTLTGSILHGFTAIYLDLLCPDIFAVSGQILYQTNYISSCEITHFIQSNNQFLFILQND